MEPLCLPYPPPAAGAQTVNDDGSMTLGITVGSEEKPRVYPVSLEAGGASGASLPCCMRARRARLPVSAACARVRVRICVRVRVAVAWVFLV
jgi:hypothetical protein